jgi:hypothetical protein
MKGRTLLAHTLLGLTSLLVIAVALGAWLLPTRVQALSPFDPLCGPPGQCPTYTHISQGLRPLTNYNFSFEGANWTDETKGCVRSGLEAWNPANAYTTGVTFTEVGSGGNFALRKVHIDGNIAGGVSEDKTYDQYGFMESTTVFFNTNTNLLESCIGHRKVALHEFGHLQGLGDADGSNNSSVMNSFSGKDDSGGNIPMEPTACDVNYGNIASTDPTIICVIPGPCPPSEYWTDEFGCCHDSWSPIIIDLDDRAPVMTAAEVWFDIRNNDEPMLLGWTELRSNSGFLALDRDGDGAITRGAELFGNFTAQPRTASPNGFVALAQFDLALTGGNRDGMIDSRDSVYSSLLLWFDRNHDGASAPGELQSLSRAGVRSIELNYLTSRRRDRHGNLFRYFSGVWLQSGRRAVAWDVFLTTLGTRRPR